MRNKLPLIARVLLGLIFFVFGLNGFLNFIPPPPNMPERMQTFFNGMMTNPKWSKSVLKFTKIKPCPC